MEHTDVWGSVQMYKAYRHIGDVLGAYRCKGHTGGVMMYRGYTYICGHTNVWGCTDVWGSV